MGSVRTGSYFAYDRRAYQLTRFFPALQCCLLSSIHSSFISISHKATVARYLACSDWMRAQCCVVSMAWNLLDDHSACESPTKCTKELVSSSQLRHALSLVKHAERMWLCSHRDRRRSSRQFDYPDPQVSTVQCREVLLDAMVRNFCYALLPYKVYQSFPLAFTLSNKQSGQGDACSL